MVLWLVLQIFISKSAHCNEQLMTSIVHHDLQPGTMLLLSPTQDLHWTFPPLTHCEVWLQAVYMMCTALMGDREQFSTLIAE